MNPVPLPVTLHKHWIGYVAIALAAVSLMGLLWAGLDSWITQPGVDKALVFQLAIVLFVVIVFSAAILMYVYSLSYIELNGDGVVISNWATPFTSKDERFEWKNDTRSTSIRGGIFGRLFNFGTISVETGGGSVQAKITLIPKPDFWQGQIENYAEQAAVKVTNV